MTFSATATAVKDGDAVILVAKAPAGSSI